MNNVPNAIVRAISENMTRTMNLPLNFSPRKNYCVGLTMIGGGPPTRGSVFLPSRIAAPATPAPRSRSHGHPAIATGGAESGRKQGSQPVCARLPAVAEVPAATWRSVEPSRIVTRPEVVSK